MGESTLKVKAVGEIGSLKTYNDELARTRRLMREINEETRIGGARPVAPPPPAPPPPAAPPPLPGPPPGAGGGASGPGGGGAGPGGPGGGSPPPPGTPAVQPWAPPDLGGLPSAGRQAVSRVGGFVSNAASTAIGVGLGTSLTGFFLGSGQKYMELSKIITHLGRRFREAGDDVAYFGGEMGFTIAESATLAERLGDQTDSVKRSTFRKALGLARQQGLDPHQAVQVVGQMTRLTGRAPTDAQLGQLIYRAQQAGMGQGRFGEFAGAIEQIMQSAFSATGHADFGSAMATIGLPGAIFGDPKDERASMKEGQSLINRVGSVVSGDTNPAMKTFMMRAMGYGSEGGPSYIDMRKRLEAGVNDPRNIMDLFKAFRARGMGRGAQYRALESVAGGSLKAFEIEAMVDNLGTAEGLNNYYNMATGGDEDETGFLRSLSTSERSAYASGGIAGLGKMGGRISMGEGSALQMEGMQMAVGQVSATAMLDLRSTLVNIAGGLNNLLGLDLGTMLTDLTGSIRDATGEWRRKTSLVDGLFASEDPAEKAARMQRVAEQAAADFDRGVGGYGLGTGR